MEHTRLLSPSTSPRVCSNSCPESVMLSNHLLLCHPLLHLPSIIPSIKLVSNESALRIRWPKYWSFSFSISLSNDIQGLFLLGLTHLKRPWCWERLRAGGEWDDRGWDGWMASPTRWTWVWADSGSWWWTGRPGMLQFMGSQRVGHDWVTELNWTDSTTVSKNLWFYSLIHTSMFKNWEASYANCF